MPSTWQALQVNARVAALTLDKDPSSDTAMRSRIAALLWQEATGAFKSTARHIRRSAFGLAAVGAGTIALILAAGFTEWVLWATREGTIQNGLGHIHVVRIGYLDHGLADPGKFLIPDETPELRTIERLPTLRVLAPRLGFNGLISRGEKTLSFIGEGVDAGREAIVSPVLNIAAGENLSSDDVTGIILGHGLAENLGVGVGDQVVLLANTGSGRINAVECRVRGLFTTVGKTYDDSALRTPISLARQLTRQAGAHRWIAVLKDTSLTDETLQAMRRSAGDAELEFIPWTALADFYNKTVALLSNQISIIRMIIAFVIVLTIANTMMMAIMERTAEIGTCMALGRTRGHILRNFVFEGLAIGTMGGVGGVIIGWLLAELISWVGIPMPPPPGMSRGYTGAIRFTWPIAIHALAVALGTTLIASAYPAWRASKLEIVDALRHSR